MYVSQCTSGFFEIIALVMPDVCVVPLIDFPSFLRFKMADFSLIDSSLGFVFIYPFYPFYPFLSQTKSRVAT